MVSYVAKERGEGESVVSVIMMLILPAITWTDVPSFLFSDLSLPNYI